MLGFGQGNYNDALMQEIAQIGDGNAAYIDTINEARKVLVDEMSSTFETVARDVKIQIEFNPARVAEYRLIGYESRALEREDFNNDKVDAGDIGAGHAVTALYELTMAGSEARAIDPLRYQASDTPVQEGRSDELAYVKLRYKLPSSDQSTLVTEPIRASRIPTEFTAASPSFRFAAAVAGYAQLLKGGTYTSDLSYADVIALARGVQLADDDGYRAEFINLVKTADALGGERLTQR